MCLLPAGVPDKSKLPIIVHIGRARPGPHGTAGEAGRFWHFFRRMVRATAASLAEGRSDVRTADPTLQIRRFEFGGDDGAGRDDLLRRIRRSDLVLLDTTAGSADLVRIIGAVMSGRGKSAALHLLQQCGPEVELGGGGVFPELPEHFSSTLYEQVVWRGRPTLRLVEPRGFAAALGANLLEAARERGCWQEGRRLRASGV